MQIFHFSKILFNISSLNGFINNMLIFFFIDQHIKEKVKLFESFYDKLYFMTQLLEQDDEKLQKLGEFFKMVWNNRVPAEEFRDLLKKQFTKEEIEKIILLIVKKIGENPKEISSSLTQYPIIIISEDPSIAFANINLENPSEISDARKIIEMCPPNIFNSLPINTEKSAISALNALLVVLMNENKSQIKKDVNQLSQSTYFSVLISSGRLFSPEKFKMAQDLFTKADPFDCPTVQLPITQVHLVMALFPEVLMIPFHFNDKFRTNFLIFTVFQLVILDRSSIKFVTIDSMLAYVFCSFLNFYLVRPTYAVSHFLNTFPKKHFNSKNIVKVKDIFATNKDEIHRYKARFYSQYYGSYDQIAFSEDRDNFENEDSNENSVNNETEKILHFFYNQKENHQKQVHIFNSDIIHNQLPNGLLPTYEDALKFLLSKPDQISIETLIEDALHYPAFTPEIANIFMQKLKEKDYQAAAILANQILKRIEDIRMTWIEQLVFFPIMRALYECLIDIYDEYQFEVLFFLFISFFEGCSSQGDKENLNALRIFISSFDEPFRLFLENFLVRSDELYICNCGINEEKPIKRLLNFLMKCKDTNDFDIDELIKYPYLSLAALIWGAITVHPNSIKLFSYTFPKYSILKRFLVYFSFCYKDKFGNLITTSNLIYSINTSECSFELIVRFPPSDEYEIRYAIVQHLQMISTCKIKIKNYHMVTLSWRAWIKMYSIKKFVVILLNTLIWASQDKLDETRSRNHFLAAQRILATVFTNPLKIKICMEAENKIKFNTEINRFEINDEIKIDKSEYEKSDEELKIAVLSTIEFVNSYQGSYSDGYSFASFCIPLIMCMKNDWKSEFKKVLNLSHEMLKDSDFKSLKNSFAANFLFISMSILEIQDLIHIEMFDSKFIQMNWRFGINYFFIQSEMKRLQQLGLVSIE